jgi:hypothetical protein
MLKILPTTLKQLNAPEIRTLSSSFFHLLTLPPMRICQMWARRLLSELSLSDFDFYDLKNNKSYHPIPSLTGFDLTTNNLQVSSSRLYVHILYTTTLCQARWPDELVKKLPKMKRNPFFVQINWTVGLDIVPRYIYIISRRTSELHT